METTVALGFAILFGVIGLLAGHAIGYSKGLRLRQPTNTKENK